MPADSKARYIRPRLDYLRSSLSINRLAIKPCLKILHTIADAAHRISYETRPNAPLAPTFYRARLDVEKPRSLLLVEHSVWHLHDKHSFQTEGARSGSKNTCWPGYRVREE
jgi:hypothetical protein